MNKSDLEIDLLKNVENLTEKVNKIMARGGRSVFSRYPLTFMLLVLFGAVAVSEGVKGILEQFDFFHDNPGAMLLLGLAVLIFTGTLYKKLDKE